MMGLENDWQELEDYDEDGAPINQKKKKKVELIGIVNETYYACFYSFGEFFKII